MVKIVFVITQLSYYHTRVVRLPSCTCVCQTPANHSIFKLQSAVGTYFREYFLMNDFMEIHSPKIIPGVSEGGSNVFKLGYFGSTLGLALHVRDRASVSVRFVKLIARIVYIYL